MGVGIADGIREERRRVGVEGNLAAAEGGQGRRLSGCSASLGLSLAVFAPPHHEGDQEGNEADGGYDHGQKDILWGV